MPLSRIEIEQTIRLRDTLGRFAESEKAVLGSFLTLAEGRMASFRAKEAVLRQRVASAARSLASCHAAQAASETPISCDAEERAYADAQSRLNRCIALIGQAEAALSRYRAEEASFLSRLEETAEETVPYLQNIIDIVEEY